MRRRLIGLFGAAVLALSQASAPAYAYPPKDADWVQLSANAEAILTAWTELDFVRAFNDSPDDLDGMQAAMRQRMSSVNAACTVMRDQIGTGGLFGPDMWTQGYRQTCWALASFQKNSARTLADKVCDETKSALNFFRAFRPKKWPAAYPKAQAHITGFEAINEQLREVIRAQKVKGCN